MPPLISEEEIDAMDSGNDSDQDLISMEMLEDICDGVESCPSINQRESCYQIRNRIRQVESFQLQMGFSFPFLRANDLRFSLLNIRAHGFLLSCT